MFTVDYVMSDDGRFSKYYMTDQEHTVKSLSSFELGSLSGVKNDTQAFY